MSGPWEYRCRAGLVMILQKPYEFALIIKTRIQMFADRSNVPGLEPVVQPFIVAIIEALLLQGPFQIPIYLRHESKGRMCLADYLRCLGPKRLRDDPPGTRKDVGQ